MEAIELNFEFTDIWVIAAIVGIAVVGLAVYKYRLKKGDESKVSGKQFLGMGIIWLFFGLGYSLWRGENLFDTGLFNLGIIFTIAGGLQLIIAKYNKKNR